MPNVTSWTESEIDILVQAWSEVEAKYPLLRCERGTGTLHAKMYALFSRRCKFPRSSTAVVHAKQHIRGFVLFVIKHDNERVKDGGRLWFDLSVDERMRRRGLVPRRSRGLTTAVSLDVFVKLLKMERVQRWLGGNTVATHNDEDQEMQSNSSFLSPRPEPPTQQSKAGSFGGSPIHELFSPSESTSLLPSTARDEETWEEKLQVPAQDCSDTSTCSLYSSSGEDSSASSPIPSEPPRTVQSPGELKVSKADQELRGQLKHRDCNILLEQMMKLQNKKMRQAASKLRADIEGEIRRSSEMLHSIISNQFEDPGSSGDVAFVAKVLNMQQQQVRDRFDQLEEKLAREEAANRALLGQRFYRGLK